MLKFEHLRLRLAVAATFSAGSGRAWQALQQSSACGAPGSPQYCM